LASSDRIRARRGKVGDERHQRRGVEALVDTDQDRGHRQAQVRRASAGAGGEHQQAGDDERHRRHRDQQHPSATLG
jgi:hypothetical protein